MNKSELIKQIADRAELSQAEAGDALDALCATVIDTLLRGEEVAIIGFGTFKELLIPASRAPKFSAGKALKDAVK